MHVCLLLIIHGIPLVQELVHPLSRSGDRFGQCQRSTVTTRSHVLGEKRIVLIAVLDVVLFPHVDQTRHVL